MTDATRPIYWHINHIWLMYVLLVPTLAVFSYGFYRRARLWRLGAPANRTDRPWERLRQVVRSVLAHSRFMQEQVAGWMHLFMLWAMVLLFVGTLVVALQTDFRIPIMHGWFYLVFQSFVLDAVGALGLVGLGIALVRRYVIQVPRLRHNRAGVPRNPDDAITLAALFLMFAQGFALEAIRGAAVPQPWDVWSPVGWLLSRSLVGAAPTAMVGWYQVIWWFHLLTVLAWIAYLPYSKMIHVFTSAAAVYFGTLGPAGLTTLEPMNFETAERFGKSTLPDFTWKDLLDLDACTACGRCQAVCPAYAAGQPLSPKNLILDLRDYMRQHGPSLLSGAPVADLPPLVGGAIREETLWACTTCRACMEACPAAIEHVPKIVGMRQHLVMDEGSAPETVVDALRSLEDRMHPFKGTSASRTDWCDGLNIPLASDVERVEVLYWVGCSAAFDPRGQKVARAFARLMQHSGVNFAILGPEETCCGDPARRMGNEFLYDTVVRQNIERLQQYNPSLIVTTCPHCLNAIGQEYRKLGGEFETLHHTQFLKQLVDRGLLQVHTGDRTTVTFHDPCYLGRWNGEYEAPRDLLAATGARLGEMEHNHTASFCCGAGGGHAWMEEQGGGPRVNQLRAQEAIATGAGVVATGCPFCLSMMEDAVKTTAGDGGPVVKDVAELLLEAHPKAWGLLTGTTATDEEE